MIANEFNLNSGAAGFITTLPLIAFAVVSPFVSKISKKIGYVKSMMLGLILILIGELIRSYTNVFGLFAGTAFIGIGIAIGNVLITSIIKLKFGKNIGAMTSIYTLQCVFLRQWVQELVFLSLLKLIWVGRMLLQFGLL